MIESVAIDFWEAAPPAFLLNGRKIQLTQSTEVSDVIALMGPPITQQEENSDGEVSTDLEYRIRAGVFSEWNFENGKLSGVDLADYGEDMVDGEELSEDDEGESTW